MPLARRPAGRALLARRGAAGLLARLPAARPGGDFDDFAGFVGLAGLPLRRFAERDVAGLDLLFTGE